MRAATTIYESFRPRLVIAIDPAVGRWTRDPIRATQVCANPTCPVHHPKQEKNRDNATWQAEQEKQRTEQAIANTTGIRVLKAIGDPVPVRLMKGTCYSF
jgi:hypothetical protein